MESVDQELTPVGATSLVSFVGDLARAGFGTLYILTSKGGSVGERQPALSMLLAIDPIATIDGTICQCADALAMCHVFDPWSNIYRTITVLEGAQAIGFSIAKLATVLSAIRPDLEALPIWPVRCPLAGVSNTVGEDVLFPLFLEPLVIANFEATVKSI
eukprot:CAMPEP_0172717296 /NCGR_PEP_ID=MMETSP1074-20121228/70981_1 /TAXON_ID=2916 /ORGANISM="Ceratium fusus, Strain PA161109" /LENGTH=158 /DNA_ID=CAMNT_0013542201 /DNA_START=361 /DNA_END=837 /DNA_ORIENTATION=+